MSYQFIKEKTKCTQVNKTPISFANLNFMKCMFFTNEQYNTNKIHVPKQSLYIEHTSYISTNIDVQNTVNNLLDNVFDKLNEDNPSGIKIKIPMPIFVMIGRKLDFNESIFDNQSFKHVPTTVYPNNPDLNNMFMSPEEERFQRIEGVNPSNPYNVPYLKKNRQIPMSNRTDYGLDEREEVASMLSEPYKRAEARREAAEYAKKSCWEKLMECFKSKKKRRGGSIGGAGVTIKDLRDFLDANPDIKNILVNDECPIDTTEQMIDNVDKFTGMLENCENPEITIDEIYNQEAGRRRKKTRKSRKTKKAKKRTKQTKRRN
jgi:hypothetical protein